MSCLPRRQWRRSRCALTAMNHSSRARAQAAGHRSFVRRSAAANPNARQRRQRQARWRRKPLPPPVAGQRTRIRGALQCGNVIDGDDPPEDHPPDYPFDPPARAAPSARTESDDDYDFKWYDENSKSYIVVPKQPPSQSTSIPTAPS
jgi:hypothetical protein